MDPDYIPHVLPSNIPEDGLHLGPDGILRHEGAWLFYNLIKLGLNLDVVNSAIKAFPGWPPDVRIPPLHAALKKGKKGGTPKNTSMLRMTGSQVMPPALTGALQTLSDSAHTAPTSHHFTCTQYGPVLHDTLDLIDEVSALRTTLEHFVEAFEAKAPVAAARSVIPNVGRNCDPRDGNTNYL